MTNMKSEKGSTYFAIFGVIIIAAAILVVSQTSLPSSRPDLSGQSEVKRFSSEKEVKDFIKSNSQSELLGYAQRQSAPQTFETLAESSGAKAAASDYSATNIQVAGVDESDHVKNDGKHIYTISGSNVVITDAFPAENMSIVSLIDLSGKNPHQLYVNNDRLVVFGNVYDYYILPLEKPLTEGNTKIASPTRVEPRFTQPTTYIKVYDISDRSNPVLKRDIEFNGSYQNSRMIGDYVYLITNTQPYYFGGDVLIPTFSPKQIVFPEIYYFDIPDYSYQFTNIVSVNVKDDNADINNKVFLLGYSNSMYVSENNIYMTYPKRVSNNYFFDRTLDDIILPVASSEVSEQINTIRNSDRPEYQKRSDIQETIQKWLDELNPEKAAQLQKQFEEKYQKIQEELAKELDKSVIHKISISNGNIEYKTKGEVPGQPLNQFSMDEYNGHFRIATTTNEVGFWGGGPIIMPAVRTFVEPAAMESEGSAGSAAVESDETTTKPEVIVEMPPSPPSQPRSLNHLYVLDENMNIVGKLEDLAPGERIFSARFLGDRAYLVTFVRIDPLFVIDLSNPTNPQVLGELKIPGVSDYLHPYDETHIFGIGRSTEDAEERVTFKGLKLSIFDVADVNKPIEMAKYEIGDSGTTSEVLNDHKAFLFSKDRNLLVLPINLYEAKSGQYWGEPTFQGAFVFDVSLENGFNLKGRITHFNETQKDKYYGYYGPYAITRSLYIGENLYTISTNMIKANKLDDISEIGMVELPGQEEPIYRILGFSEALSA